MVVEGEAHHRLANTQTYSEWQWDGDRLQVRNCRLGMHPLYWRATDDGIAVATSPLLLLQDGIALDEPALAVFMRLGFLVGEDTPFVGVRQLAPGSVLQWHRTEGVRLHTPPLPRNPVRTIDRADAERRYAELFSAAVARCLPVQGRLCLPLSGGRDSRHIALALHAAGVRPHSYVTLQHLPGRANEDVRVATLLAQALGGSHAVLRQPRFYVRNMQRNLLDSALCADEGAQLPPLTDWLRQHADVVFDGIGGDVMSAGLFQNAEVHALYRRGDLAGVADQVFGNWRSSVRGWQHATPAPLAGRLGDEVARERLMEELARHQDHHNPARAFYFWNRTRREIALQPFLLFRGLQVETPFLDRELWDFLDSLPYELVGERRFHTDTIRRAYPAFAHIPFESASAPRGTTPLQRFCLGADLAPILIKEGGAMRLRLLLRCARLFAGARIWWNPNMVLYMLALNRIAGSGRARA